MGPTQCALRMARDQLPLADLGRSLKVPSVDLNHYVVRITACNCLALAGDDDEADLDHELQNQASLWVRLEVQIAAW